MRVHGAGITEDVHFAICERIVELLDPCYSQEHLPEFEAATAAKGGKVSLLVALAVIDW